MTQGSPEIVPVPAELGAAALEVTNLSKTFEVHGEGGFRSKQIITVLDDISLAVRAGETLGLVGESGCGKSTLARCLVRLLEPSAGHAYFHGRDLSEASQKQLREIRRQLQFVFQDPNASLDPRMSVESIVEEPLLIHQLGDAGERGRLVGEILGEVGLTAQHARRRPHALSGGQRQRIGIARALVLRPEVVILDEPVSALDVSVQAQVLNLLRDLQRRHGLTYVFITHDMAVAEYVCDRIAVLYLGQIMESATAGALFKRPLHPYTVSLLSSVPIPRAGGRARRASRPEPIGEVTSVLERPSGCPFESRCPVGRGRDVCRDLRPAMTEPEEGHFVACHFPGELEKPKSR